MSVKTKTDWSQGTAFFQKGTIYCSPNSKRVVVIPPKDNPSCNPFEVNPAVRPSERTEVHPALAGTCPSERRRVHPEYNVQLDKFKQPVQWDNGYSWLAFVPLSPSFVSLPFEPLCWMPSIKCSTQKRKRTSAEASEEDVMKYVFDMNEKDQTKWEKCENCMVLVAEKLRLWYRIPGSPPPLPETFGYQRSHQSQATATTMIEISRNAFVLWMGFLSYLIAQTRRPEHAQHLRSDPKMPVTAWHLRLLAEHHKDITEAWLDGLYRSNVCSFNAQTSRVGIVYKWTADHKTRPPIDFFLENHIPFYYPWRILEEETLRTRHANREALRPPNALLKQVMDDFLGSMDVPLACFFVRQYYKTASHSESLTMKLLGRLHTDSFIYGYINEHYKTRTSALDREWADPIQLDLDVILQRSTEAQKQFAIESADLPTQTMISVDDEDNRDSKLFDDWQSYWVERLSKWHQRLKEENHATATLRKQREKQKPLKHTTMYHWKTMESTGGVTLYMRTRLKKSEHEKYYSMCGSRRRVYNGLFNEWDLCEDFDPPRELAEGASYATELDDDSDDDGYDCGFVSEAGSLSQDLNTHSSTLENTPASSIDTGLAYGASGIPDKGISNQLSPIAEMAAVREPDILMSMEDHEDGQEQENGLQQDTRSWIIPESNMINCLQNGYGYLPVLNTLAAQHPADWSELVQTFGFIAEHMEQVGLHDQNAIQQFYCSCIEPVATQMPAALSDLNDHSRRPLANLQDFRKIHRPHRNLFVFSEPRPQSADWMLGVETAEIVLYVCRLMLAKPWATIDAIASKLLSKGVPCRTLTGIWMSTQSTIVSQKYAPVSLRPAGYTFGIEDFEAYRLQCEGIVHSRHGRAAVLMGGLVSGIASEYLSLDYCLSGPSLEITENRQGYMIPAGNMHWYYCDDQLTEHELATICGTYTMYTGFGDQITVKSWFPPANLWDVSGTQNGRQWVEWTLANEKWYQDRVRQIRIGTTHPMTRTHWKQLLRGTPPSRKLHVGAAQRAQTFMDIHMAVVPNYQPRAGL